MEREKEMFLCCLEVEASVSCRGLEAGLDPDTHLEENPNHLCWTGGSEGHRGLHHCEIDSVQSLPGGAGGLSER